MTEHVIDDDEDGGGVVDGVIEAAEVVDVAKVLT